MDKDFHNYQDEAELLKALAHPVRICIVRGLLQKGECNVSFMTDCLDMPQSTISQHLQKLKACGILKAKRQGLEVIYSIRDERIAKIIKALFE